jgi:hypothetical protein
MPEIIIRAIARWSEPEGGSTFEWPQATVDNRRSRVLARIERFGIPCDPETLIIERVA